MAIQPAGRGPQLIGVYSFFVALTTITVFLRAYCRLFLVKSFGLDDWFAVVAWVFLVIFSAFAITGCFHGTGQHAANIIPPTEIPVALKWWWACEPVYVLANMAIKASIAVMLLRLIVVRTHRIIIHATLALTILYSTFYFFLFILQCRPSSYFWTQYTGAKGTCVNPSITVNATYAYSAITCLTDWTYAILPIFLVRKLQMGRRQKVVVGGILALGAIASTATIIRIPYIHTLSDKADFLYATTGVAIWSCCETGLGIAAASAATLRPLFRSFFGTSQGMSGYPSIHQQQSTWPAGGSRGAPSRGQGAGYVRSHSRGDTEELRLREGVGPNRTVNPHRGLDMHPTMDMKMDKPGWTDVIVEDYESDRDAEAGPGHSVSNSPGTDTTDENGANARWRNDWDRKERDYVSRMERA